MRTVGVFLWGLAWGAFLKGMLTGWRYGRKEER